MLSKILRAQSENHGIADGLKEEESEQAADSGPAWGKGYSESEDRTCDAVEAEEKGRIYPIEKDDSDETELRNLASQRRVVWKRNTHRPTVNVIWQYEKS